MVIDAHVHVWDLAARDQPWIPAGSALRRSFGLDDVAAVIAGTPVERVVLVQVINDAAETAELLAAAGHPLVAGVVGWVDFTAPDSDEAIAELARTRSLVGVRHQALAEVNPAAWLLAPPVDTACRALEQHGLVFELIARPEHLAAATTVARAHPSLRVVLDHLGKPPITSGQLEPWASEVRRLAAEPNVRCKLSGIQTVAATDWEYADLAPFLDVALGAFGPDRLMFGSDWPVSSTAASYGQVFHVARRLCAELTASEAEAILGGAAAATYRLGSSGRGTQAVKPPSTE